MGREFGEFITADTTLPTNESVENRAVGGAFAERILGVTRILSRLHNFGEFGFRGLGNLGGLGLRRFAVPGGSLGLLALGRRLLRRLDLRGLRLGFRGLGGLGFGGLRLDLGDRFDCGFWYLFVHLTTLLLVVVGSFQVFHLQLHRINFTQ